MGPVGEWPLYFFTHGTEDNIGCGVDDQRKLLAEIETILNSTLIINESRHEVQQEHGMER
jgi:hypothetical protein